MVVIQKKRVKTHIEYHQPAQPCSMSAGYNQRWKFSDDNTNIIDILRIEMPAKVSNVFEYDSEMYAWNNLYGGHTYTQVSNV